MDAPIEQGDDVMGNAEDHDLLIRLDAKMDEVLLKIACIPDVTKRQGILEEKQETDRKEIDRLRSTNNIWSFINTVGVVIAGVLGFTRP